MWSVHLVHTSLSVAEDSRGVVQASGNLCIDKAAGVVSVKRVVTGLVKNNANHHNSMANVHVVFYRLEFGA